MLLGAIIDVVEFQLPLMNRHGYTNIKKTVFLVAESKTYFVFGENLNEIATLLTVRNKKIITEMSHIACQSLRKKKKKKKLIHFQRIQQCQTIFHPSEKESTIQGNNLLMSKFFPFWADSLEGACMQ